MFVISIVPVIAGLGRGLWLSAGLGLVYAAIRLAIGGQGQGVAGHPDPDPDDARDRVPHTAERTRRGSVRGIRTATSAASACTRRRSRTWRNHRSARSCWPTRSSPRSARAVAWPEIRRSGAGRGCSLTPGTCRRTARSTRTSASSAPEQPGSRSRASSSAAPFGSRCSRAAARASMPRRSRSTKDPSSAFRTSRSDTPRLRYFGGTTNHWAGVCRPFDSADFERREWVPVQRVADGEWPSCDPYVLRAEEVVQLTSDRVGHRVRGSSRDQSDPLPLVGDRVLTRVDQIVPPDKRRFAGLYGDELKAASERHRLPRGERHGDRGRRGRDDGRPACRWPR